MDLTFGFSKAFIVGNRRDNSIRLAESGGHRPVRGTGRGTELPPIEFENIRPHSGSQQIGFEELGVQIFRSECESSGDFHRVEGTGGDGGVEAYVVRGDNSEIGLQCKWFKLLGPAQWRQLDESVNTALIKHPKLSEYRIAIPLNRTPGQLKLWKDHERKWQKKSERHIHFVWLGKSELSDLLSRPPHRELLLYWFGLPQFTHEWMGGAIDLAIQNLDRRYSPKQHVDTEAGRLIEAFAWSPTFTESMKRLLVELVNAWRKCSDALRGNTFEQPIQSQASRLTVEVGRLTAAELPAMRKRSVAAALADADGAMRTWEKLHREVDELHCAAKKATPRDASPARDYQFFLLASSRFGDTLRGWRQFLDRSLLADKSHVLLLGDAGTGKSHLIASVVEHARGRRQPALFLLGEQFTGTDEPWAQAARVLGWDTNAEWLLSALNQAGALAGRPALVCIDALNESEHRNLWVSHLNGFAAKLAKFPFVRLIVSCRSDFAEITLPSRLASAHEDAWARVMHHGFGEEVFEAVANYFEGYRVQSSHFPPLIEEFRNPLFLRLFCEAFEDKRLPDGPVTLKLVMSARIERLTSQLQKHIDCSPDDVKAAINAVAALIRDNRGRSVDKEAVRSAVNAYSPVRSHSRSLYTHLRSNGLLVEITELSTTPKDSVKVRFAFERFSDYFIAAELLDGIGAPGQLEAAWGDGGTLASLAGVGEYWRNRGLLAALAILVPERHQIELVDLVQATELRGRFLADFLDSLPWRSAQSFTERSLEVLRESQCLGCDRFIQAVLRVATIPGHPYNAEFIHARLLQMPLCNREVLWTIPIANLTQDASSVPSMIITWAMRAPPRLVSEGQALLVARILCWFTSSNRRSFRKQATLAAIHILEGRGQTASQMLRELADANDPYVVERAYAVACGVALREPCGPVLRELAAVVHKHVFSSGSAPPHVLLRDYAQTVLEAAAHQGCLPDGVATDSFRHPMKSSWPRIWTETQVRRLEEDEGWRQILSSVRPESMMDYGDFGRYVMGSKLHYFSDVRKTRRYPEDGNQHEFDDRIARRWILQRVLQLGWTPARFGKYEERLPWAGRHEADEIKVERISKKYQWIALFELLGYISDHFHMRPDWREKSPPMFHGAWQISAREFDPSAPAVDVGDDDGEREVPPAASTSEVALVAERYPCPFENTALCAKRGDWVLAVPSDFKTLIYYPQLIRQDPHSWLALSGFWIWREPEYQAHKLGGGGRLEMWMHVRSWLVDENDYKKFLARVREIHFWGHGCQGVSLGEGWLGEYPWGGSFAETREWCRQPDDWIKNARIQHTQSVCSWDDRRGFIVPSPQLCDLMALRWSGSGPRFCAADGQLAAFQSGTLGASEDGPILVREDALREALRRARLRLVWGLVGERHCWDHSTSGSPRCVGGNLVQFSGVYTIGRKGLLGGLTKRVVEQVGRRK